MKKYFYLFAAATAMMLTACTTDNVNEAVQNNVKVPQAIVFDTYTSGTTRAGEAGVMTTTTLQTTGFGVFAWQGLITPGYTDAAPNFMYNEKISYPSGAWTYSPLKYWPNETDNDSETGNTATMTQAEGLSFLAYAPYVAYTDAVAGTGITSMSANNAVPAIGYTIATKPSESVDLLWGVAQTGGFSYTDVKGTTSGAAVGMPLLNLKKPAKEQKIKFLFKHALARLGVTIVAAVDQVAAGGKLDENTKIFVNSITIEDGASTKTLPTTGSLNLNNITANVAKWTASAGTLSLILNASNELSEAIQAGTGSVHTGVTTTEQNAIKDGKYFMLIPTQGKQATFKVTINYDVVTTDEKVGAGKVTTNNVITKTVLVGDATNGFENNKAYNLKLILGMTSVKLDAEVADWEIQGSTDVDLPKNM